MNFIRSSELAKGAHRVNQEANNVPSTDKDLSDRPEPEISMKAWELIAEAKIKESIKEGDLNQGGPLRLAGFGKPLAEIDQAVESELRRLRKKEESDPYEGLPPAMKLRKDVASRLLSIMELSNRKEAEAATEELNKWIEVEKKNIPWGPPATNNPLDLETVLGRWDQHHSPQNLPDPSGPLSE